MCGLTNQIDFFEVQHDPIENAPSILLEHLKINDSSLNTLGSPSYDRVPYPISHLGPPVEGFSTCLVQLSDRQAESGRQVPDGRKRRHQHFPANFLRLLLCFCFASGLGFFPRQRSKMRSPILWLGQKVNLPKQVNIGFDLQIKCKRVRIDMLCARSTR